MFRDRLSRPLLRFAVVSFLGGLIVGASTRCGAASGAPAGPGGDVPYVWHNVKIGGGGFVTGVEFHPAERGLAYARTDVGGAYRWNDNERRWIPLTDWLGPNDVNLLGIDSLATDPQDASRVYLAAGTYNHPRQPRAAFLASHDRGTTFSRHDFNFGGGGNELGRGNGERLAVDPCDGRVLFFGSRDAGLWRSADRGASWQRVETFPAAATAPESTAALTPTWSQAVGIVFVFFERVGEKSGQPTQTLYAGVSTRGSSLFVSRDAGATWSPVAGAPMGFRPTRWARDADGTLYFTYGNEPGPNTMTDGAVWRFAPSSGEWADITPERGDGKPNTGFGFAAVATDPANPGTLLTATFCRWEPGDELYRSTDGGRTWSGILRRAGFDHAGAPWIAQMKPHWISAIAIDPFDPDHAIFTTGYGVWATRGLRAADRGGKVEWSFEDDGLEETVPLGINSPPEGAPLLSALGDLDGFRHDDLTAATSQYAAPPRFTNGEDVVFAAQRPLVLVRSGTIRGHKGQVRIAHSSDGGKSWAALATEPPLCGGSGKVAVSADGATVIWTPRRVLAPGQTSPGRREALPSPPFVTTDLGATWTECVGIPAGTRVLADAVDAKTFHALVVATGEILASEDGGLHFAVRGKLPFTPPAGPDAWSPPDSTLHVVPARRGELWIASRSQGLFRTTDGGATVIRFDGPESITAFGLGCPAPSRTEPTLFLVGRVKNTSGIFRSIDSGRSWRRIDDEGHRFGTLNQIVGDPRVYGRIYGTTPGRGIIYGDPR